MKTPGKTARPRPVFLPLRLALGLILAVSAIPKVLAPAGFVAILDQYGFPLPGYAAALLVGLELAVGALLLVGRLQGTALIGSGALLLAYWVTTLFGPSLLIGCGCFGVIGPTLTAAQHLALLSAMTLAWAVLLWARRPDGGRRWLTTWRGRTVAMLLLLAIAVVGSDWSRDLAAIPTQARAFRAIPVVTLDGKATVVDATRAPVLFFAYWCPHCAKLLQDMAGRPLAVRPVLVSTFFRREDGPGARERTLAQLKEAGLRPEDGWTIYLDVNHTNLVESVPTLAYMAGGQWYVKPVPDIKALQAALAEALPK